jgi:putative sigma-54 modulation protein
MKLIYSGKTKDFTPEFEEKVAVKLAKLSRVSEQRGEREIHLVHHSERGFHKVEIHMNFYDHTMVGEGVDGDLTTSFNLAVEKMEKQLLKYRDKWRDLHRDPKGTRETKESWDSRTGASTAPETNGKAAKALANGNGRSPKIFRVNYGEDRKPMTLDEAMLEISGPGDYVVYRDANRNCLSVLVGRTDGNFDLIES